MVGFLRICFHLHDGSLGDHFQPGVMGTTCHPSQFFPMEKSWGFQRRDVEFMYSSSKVKPFGNLPGCLGYIDVYRGWTPTQLCRDYNKPWNEGSLFNNQGFSWKVMGFCWGNLLTLIFPAFQVTCSGIPASSVPESSSRGVSQAVETNWTNEMVSQERKGKKIGKKTKIH